jgi:dGTPase
LLREEELPERPIAVLGATGSQRIDTLVHDMVEHSARAGDVVQGPEAGPAMAELRKFMFEHVYLGPAVRAEHARIANVVRKLFEHYVEHPELLPAIGGVGEADDRAGDGRGGGQSDLAERVTDYVAGMTDRYCIREYTDLEVPRVFAR